MADEFKPDDIKKKKRPKTFSKRTRKKLQNEGGAFTANIIKAEQKLMDDMIIFMNTREVMKRSEIAKQLNLEKNLLSGLFGAYKATVMNEMRNTSYTIQEIVMDDDIDKLLGYNSQTLETWSAVMVSTCATCVDLHGQTKKRETWNSTGRPRERFTLCGVRCHCQLVPFDVVPTRAEMHKPLFVESQRVRKAEKKRGKKFSDSYKLQILGNINNPRFKSPAQDLRKIKKVV